jgi:hypothetical protein
MVPQISFGLRKFESSHCVLKFLLPRVISFHILVSTHVVLKLVCTTVRITST